MFEIIEYKFNNKFNLYYSYEILKFSLPNKNYQLIASSTFNIILDNFNLKKKKLLDEILSLDSEFNFINAHGSFKNNEWVLYPNSSNEYISINEFLKDLNSKKDIHSILYICNPNNYQLKNKKVIYPIGKVHSTNIENDKWIIV